MTDADMIELQLSMRTRLLLRRTRVAPIRLPDPDPVPTPVDTSHQGAPTDTLSTSSVRSIVPFFKGSGTAHYQDPEEFLARFEIAMELSGVPTSQWSSLLQPQLQLFTDLHYWRLNAAFLPWQEAKSLFLSHFLHPNVLQRRIDELTQIRQQPDETVQHYTDRFSNLVSLSQQEPTQPLLTTYFRRGLHNKHLRKMIEFREDIKHPFATFEQLAETALFCEAQLLRSQQDQAILQHVKDRPGYRSTGHRPVDRRVVTTKRTFHCSLHGENRSHSSADCIALATRSTSSSPSSSSSTASSSPSASSSPTSTITCFKCNKKGHYANKCPGTGKEKSASTVTLLESNNDSPHSELLLPMQIEGRTVQALLDTGASCSFLRTDLGAAFRAPSLVLGGSIQLADGSIQPRHGVTRPLHISCNGCSVTSSFELMPNMIHEAIIGRDLLFRFGIVIGGLPPPSATVVIDDSDDNMLEDPKNDTGEEATSLSELIKSSIEVVLQQNTEIPADSFCSFPGSIVSIQTDKPVFRRQYPIPFALRNAVDKQIEKWLATKRITKADPSSQWNLPLTCAPKKDLQGFKTDVRVCMDPRAINEVLPDDNYPIPRISELFEKLQGFTVASSLDLKESYTQLLVAEEDRKKLTFTWNSKRYSWTGAPYGLKFLTSHFQRTMTTILHECMSFVLVYVDDIVVFSPDIETHVLHLQTVIETLNRYHLRLNLEKCRFGRRQLLILGHILSGTSVSADPSKLTTMQSIPEPVTGKQLESFLGFANYLRDYIPLLSSVAAPLERLRKLKFIGEEWTQECQLAFDTIKALLSAAPTLNHAHPDHELLVATDASEAGVGAVLYQHINGRNQYISFASKALNKAQTNYPATRRELLAVIFAVSKFRHWLYGRKFSLYCDHAALSYLFNGQHESKMLNYWAFCLLEYQFNIHHRPGVLNVLPDALSRVYPSAKGKDEGGAQLRLANIELDSLPGQSAEPRKRGKTQPAADERISILEALHGLNHLGTDALYNQAWKQGHNWPTMFNDAKTVVNSCQTCMKHVVTRQGFHPLIPIEAKLPFDHIGIDLMGPFPTSQSGNNFALVVVDIATRFSLLRPLTNKTAEATADQLYRIFADFGFPKIIQSDNGAEFVNKTVNDLKQLCGFDHRTISAYHPQANGAAEAHVKLSKMLLTKLCNGEWTSWDLFLPATQYGINCRITKRHSSTPFSLMFARTMNPLSNFKDVSSDLLTEEELVKRMTTMLEVIHPSVNEKTSRYSKRMKASFHRRHRIHEASFSEGTKVMLETQPRTSKLKARYEGPFSILRQTTGRSYELLDATGKLYPHRVSSNRLKLISTSELPTSYEIDNILAHRGKPNKREYLVHWKGYDSSHDSWEPASNFDSPIAISQYWDSLKTGKE